MATLTTLTSEVIRLLNEATDSSVGEVGNGSGTVSTTTSQTIETYLNEAIKEQDIGEGQRNKRDVWTIAVKPFKGLLLSPILLSTYPA